ncbi:carboxypeptidase-like regulatory domain-containing protein [Winogradskyella litoriviva]|uniref:Carboxypeptidase-like regulatory domain-containing protein n=1 Tax=Winogradskyella litoriviva TaxID=1220182 RepID=A0ABX2E4Q2_9FLAO|nr:carboxypeptidase-like regulatory domain-containing protein [Winogradskyella litoriviva]NRD23267.1 carboxypeptidase-like regulatory domain-containing protein [Winogradskyella litoriviva]
MKKMTLFTIALCYNLIAMAQISVTGIVTNDSIPLESANVFIKNSTKGIATNSKGEFKLEATKGDTLSVSYLGYKSQEFVIYKTEQIEIKLEEDSFDEVVVIGYQNATKIWYKAACGGYSVEVFQLKNKLIKANKLFPNPSSSGIFQLKLVEDYEEVKIAIANMSGRIIQSSTFQKFGSKIDIDLSEYSTGIYIVNIIADDKRLEPIKAIRN